MTRNIYVMEDLIRKYLKKRDIVYWFASVLVQETSVEAMVNSLESSQKYSLSKAQKRLK